MDDCNAKRDLSDRALRALERARAARLSYGVRAVQAPDGRIVAILGEAHLKLAKASAIGKEVVGAFELRGVETFQRKQVFGGRLLGFVINAPRALLRWLTFGAVKSSTIADAKQLASGYTVELERAKKVPFGLHVSSVYISSFFLIEFVALLLSLRWSSVAGVAVVVTMLASAFKATLKKSIAPAKITGHQQRPEETDEAADTGDGGRPGQRV